MFVVGYEVDLGLVRGRGRVAASVAVGSIVVPLALGTGLGVWLAPPLPRARRDDVRLVLRRRDVDHGVPRPRPHSDRPRAAPDQNRRAGAGGRLRRRCARLGAARGGDRGRRARAPVTTSSGWSSPPVYAAVMIWLVRPALRRLADVYQRQGRLTPNVLAAVLALLLLSSYVTDWMGVKFIFGAFIFGIVMPQGHPGAPRGHPGAAGTDQRARPAPGVLRDRGTERQPARHRPVGSGRSGADHAGGGRGQVRRRLLRCPADRGQTTAVRRAGLADEHPRPDRDRHPHRGPPARHPEQVAVHADGRDGHRHDGNGRPAAQGHLPDADHGARYRRGRPGRARPDGRAPDPRADRRSADGRPADRRRGEACRQQAEQRARPVASGAASGPPGGSRSVPVWAASCCR